MLGIVSREVLTRVRETFLEERGTYLAHTSVGTIALKRMANTSQKVTFAH